MLEVGKIVYSASVFRSDVVDLRQIPLRDDRVVDVAQHLGRVGVQVGALLVAHDALVQLTGLIVLAELALVPVVGLARDDVVGDLVRCFGDVRAEFVLEGVGGVLLAAAVVGVDAHGAVRVDAAEGTRHEGAVDGDLVQVDADAVVLGVAVEPAAVLQEGRRLLARRRGGSSPGSC
jgi:hypothetical protein